MARWAIPGKTFQTVWVNPLTIKQNYNSAAYLDVGGIIHMLLAHESVPVGSYLETAPGLDADLQQKAGIDSVCDFLKSRARIDFIRLSRVFPDGTDDDCIEPHVKDGVRVFKVIPVDRPARKVELNGLLQPGAFPIDPKRVEAPLDEVAPETGDSALAHGDGSLVMLGAENEDDDLTFEPFRPSTIAALEKCRAGGVLGDDEAGLVMAADGKVERIADVKAEIARLKAINDAEPPVFDFDALREQRKLEASIGIERPKFQGINPPMFDSVNPPISEMAQRRQVVAGAGIAGLDAVAEHYATIGETGCNEIPQLTNRECGDVMVFDDPGEDKDRAEAVKFFNDAVAARVQAKT